MIHFRNFLPGLALLALSCAAAQACQLSLASPLTQQPLNYNPFEAGASQAAITFTLKNSGSKPCDAAFAFFKPGLPEASGAGAIVNYRILASGGSLIQNAPSPPSMLSPTAGSAQVTIGAHQAYTATAILSVDQAQTVPPGTYTDILYLGVYQNTGGSQYARAQITPPPITLVIGVSTSLTVAIAGGGRKTTLNFGDLVQGATRAVQLRAYANQGFRLTVSSDNSGVMKPIDKQAIAEGIWQVPYTIAVNRMPPVSLSQPRPLSLWPSATQRTGVAIPVEVQIGSIAGQRAGIYRDVITIAIDPGS